MYGAIKYSYKKLDQIVQQFFERLVSKIVDKNILKIPRFCKNWLQYKCETQIILVFKSGNGLLFYKNDIN